MSDRGKGTMDPSEDRFCSTVLSSQAKCGHLQEPSWASSPKRITAFPAEYRHSITERRDGESHGTGPDI